MKQKILDAETIDAIYKMVAKNNFFTWVIGGKGKIKTAERCQFERCFKFGNVSLICLFLKYGHDLVPNRVKNIGVKWTHSGPGGSSGRYLGPRWVGFFVAKGQVYRKAR